MNFMDFSMEWIEENIPTSEIYGDKIASNVFALCMELNKQHNSGVSWNVTIKEFEKLLKEYDKGE